MIHLELFQNTLNDKPNMLPFMTIGELERVLDQIPVEYNLISHVILIGVFQGFFMSAIILIKTSRKIIPVKLLGYFFLTLSLVMLDGYLCYTGLMKHFIYLNDASEPLVLLWAPLLYLFIYNVLEKRAFKFRAHWYHFLVPFLYFISQIGYYMHPYSVKLNAYISAYFPNIKHIRTAPDLNYGYQLIKDEFRWIILISFVSYIILSFRLILKDSSRRLINAKKKGINKHSFSRNILAIFFGLMLIALTIFLNFDNDLGDHYIGIVQTVFILTTSFMIFSESRFFEKSWIADKYETLSVQEGNITLSKVESYIEIESYFTRQDASLNDLSANLKVNSNYLSKIINLGKGKNFNEFINSYRVRLAQQRLLNKEFENFTIEAIGNSVGFKSKSAFYKAFKQQTNTSPTAFVKKHREANLS